MQVKERNVASKLAPTNEVTNDIWDLEDTVAMSRQELAQVLGKRFSQREEFPL